MSIDQQIIEAGNYRRGAVWIVFVGMVFFTALTIVGYLWSIFTWDLDRMADIGAGSAVYLGFFFPLLVISNAALQRRGLGSTLWYVVIAGGLIQISAPVFIALLGGGWDTEVIFPGRTATTWTLRGFIWLALVPGVLMVAGGIYGLVQLTSQKRGRPNGL